MVFQAGPSFLKMTKIYVSTQREKGEPAGATWAIVLGVSSTPKIM